MAGLLFGAMTENDALTASTAKTVIGILAPTNQCVKIFGLYVGFDSVNVAGGPALLELCTCTFATNSPAGPTNCSAATKNTTNGRPETIQTSAGKTWSAEPTVITVTRAFFVPTFMGAAVMYFPLAKEMFVPGAAGACLRITSPVACNFTGGFDCEE